MSGSKTCEGGEARELCPLPRQDEAFDRLFMLIETATIWVVDAVPAWVCGQCGEAYFDEREVDAIQQAIRSLDDHTRKLVIPA